MNEQEMKEIADSVLKPAELAATFGAKLADPAAKTDKEKIIEALKQVYDPEIPINIYDLGLIYQVEQSYDGDVYIEMTLTTPTCPIAGDMPKIVATTVTAQTGVGLVTVRIVWEPAWSLARLSDDAKAILEMM